MNDIFSKTEQRIYRLLVGEIRCKYPFQCVFKPESTGNDEGYGNERNHGHCTEKAKRNSLKADFLCGEGLDGQSDDPQVLYETLAHTRQLVEILIPDSVGQIVFKSMYFLFYLHCLSHATPYRRTNPALFPLLLFQARHLQAALT